MSADKDTLEEKTKKYWQLALCWRRPDAAEKKFNVAQALYASNDIIFNTDPSRKLAVKTFYLRESIVQGEEVNHA